MSGTGGRVPITAVNLASGRICDSLNRSSTPPHNTFVMQNMAWSIDRHQFNVSIEGHTRSKLELDRPDYTGWELSADRANAARRLLQHYAVEARLIERVNASVSSYSIGIVARAMRSCGVSS